MFRVQFLVDGLTVQTKGLRWSGRPELRVGVATASLVPKAEAFLRHVVTYLQHGDRQLRAGETLRHGYWITKLQDTTDHVLEFWEFNATMTDWVPGATRTLIAWQEQHGVCDRSGAPFAPPRPDQLAAISAGIMEGQPTEGVRYPSPEHMSGWWLTTDLYDGDVRSLRVEHLYHVTAARPDLLPFLALPFGYRFALGGQQERIWFDDAAAS